MADELTEESHVGGATAYQLTEEGHVGGAVADELDERTAHEPADGALW